MRRRGRRSQYWVFRHWCPRSCGHHSCRRDPLSCHTLLDVDNVVIADRENSAPTFMIPSRTPCSSASPPQRHGEPGSHWLHQDFHAPASSFSNSHEHTLPSSPPLISIRSCSPSTSSSPPFLNHRPYRLLSASAVSFGLKEENGPVWDVTWSRHRLSTSSSTKSSTTLRNTSVT